MRLLHRRLRPQRDMKSSSFPQFARHSHIAPVHLHQALRDRETQPRASVSAAHAAVRLGEFIENERNLISRNARPGVPHREMEPQTALPLAPPVQLHFPPPPRAYLTPMSP